MAHKSSVFSLVKILETLEILILEAILLMLTWRLSRVIISLVYGLFEILETNVISDCYYGSN